MSYNDSPGFREIAKPEGEESKLGSIEEEEVISKGSEEDENKNEQQLSEADNTTIM